MKTLDYCVLRGVRAFVVLLLVGAAVLAQAAPTSKPVVDTALDQQFHDDVERVSKDAAAAFDRGNELRAAQDPANAATEYRKAIELAPGVDHPHRRLCTMLVGLSQFDDAIAECRKALALSPASPYDKSALASALLARRGPADPLEALHLADDAARTLPGDVSLVSAWCFAAAAAENRLSLRECTHRLMQIDPDGIEASFFGAIMSAGDQDYKEAHRRLEKAKRLGLPDEQYQALHKAFLEDEEQHGPAVSFDWQTAASIALWIVGLWLGVMALLLASGFALSRMTLREVNRAATTSADAWGTERERRLRKLYKAVLLLSGVYFYLSLPLLLATVILVGGGSLYFFVAMGTIPFQLVVIVGVVVLGTIGAIFRSLFVRALPPNLGTRMDLTAHPKLRALLDDVAATIGTHPVDVAYLTPGTDMAVTERAGVWSSLRGKRTERSLIMGVGLFDRMTQLQLRAVLAHEFGHFRNADTAGGGFALAVRRSLYTLILRLAQSGAARMSNPAWWFVRGFHRMYLGISQGASRLQEVLADRWAIKAYGSDAFIAGYRHVVSRAVTFDVDVDATLEEVIEERAALPNLYRYSPKKKPPAAEVAAQIRSAMTREPTIYDSHPTTEQRLDWAQKLAAVHEAQPGDAEPVWALFADREAVEREMTDVVRLEIRAKHGLTIRAEKRDEPVDL